MSDTQDVLAPWRARMTAARAAAEGATALFNTTYQLPVNDYSHAHFARSGQQVRVEEPIIEPCLEGEPDAQFDEESLPYYFGRFADGARLVIQAEECFSHDPLVTELFDAVASGFAVARDLDFVGPYDLAERGSQEDKERFMREVPTWKFDAPSETFVNFNVPDEFRPKKGRVRKGKSAGGAAHP